jgi:hypothetical protein
MQDQLTSSHHAIGKPAMRVGSRDELLLRRQTVVWFDLDRSEGRHVGGHPRAPGTPARGASVARSWSRKQTLPRPSGHLREREVLNAGWRQLERHPLAARPSLSSERPVSSAARTVRSAPSRRSARGRPAWWRTAQYHLAAGAASAEAAPPVRRLAAPSRTGDLQRRVSTPRRPQPWSCCPTIVKSGARTTGRAPPFLRIS